MLDRVSVRAFYDRFGARQDSQAFYEDAALRDLEAAAAFEDATGVYELGCGTGRFAEIVLTRLPRAGTYSGVDLSSTMVDLARTRLARFGTRAAIRLADGDPRVVAADASVDRVVSTYVLDLLPEPEILQFVAEAARALAADGRLCLVSLTGGTGLMSRVVIAAWMLVYRMAPRLVGGCRPIELLDFLSEGDWRLLHHRVIVAWGIPSEIVVAVPRTGHGPTDVVSPPTRVGP